MAPPKVERRNHYIHHYRPTEKKPVKPEVPQQNVPPVYLAPKYAEMNFYGDFQKNRLERFIVPGVAGISAFRELRDIRLAESTIRADNAYRVTYQRELNAFTNPSSVTNPPKNLVEVSQRAEAAYTAELKLNGFTPLDVRGTSVVKAAEFLRTQANSSGDFTTLSAETIRQRLISNPETNYFVRILDQNHLNNIGSQFSRGESPHTWVATPEEIAGAKLDVFETMKRVGYSDEYIDWIKGEVSANRKNLSDFILSVTEADANTGKTTPSWDVLIDRAKASPEFDLYKTKPESFWRDVAGLDYKTELSRYNSMDKDVYLKSLTAEQRDVFNARRQMGSILGVNEYFTNDGRTARTDGKNETYGVREFLIDNGEIRNTQRTTFVDLNETGNTNLTTTDKAPVIPDNFRNFRNESRNGALIGGTFSAVTSLPQIFEQAQNGDYSGAAKTFVTNTALGTSVGGFSSAGEQIIGNRITSGLSNSTVFQNGVERLYTNGAARNFVSRMAGTETSALSSQTFSSTVRTFAGRVGGAGVVGGIVNGAFSAYDQIGAYNRGEVTASQAIGTVTGEAAVGVGAGMAGAAAGAAIGSIIPGAGTIVGGVIGFGVGMLAGYLADKGLRGLGVNTLIAKGVTATIDAGAELVNNVGSAISDVGNAIGGGLKSMFSW